MKIVSVGRLSHEKGHEVLIRAFALFLEKSRSFQSKNNSKAFATQEAPPPSSLSLKNEQGENKCVELHLIGDGPLMNSLQTLAGELNVAKQVVFHGYVDNPYPMVHRAQLFVLPSLYEGLPNALLEAMACEAPTLVTDCPGGIREATDNGRLSRLVPANDSSALAQAIFERFEFPENFLSRVDTSRERIESKHSYPRWLAKLEEVLSY